jgi:hypothetical protein
MPSDLDWKTLTMNFRLHRNPKPKELSEEEFRRVLDERVSRTLHMNLDEFAAALREGRLDPEEPRVAGLAILVNERVS